MKEEIFFEDLVYNLDKAIIKLNLQFLKKLLINASNCDKPWRNKRFIKLICVKWHKKGFSSSIYNWFSGKRNITLKFLKSIIKISNYSWSDMEKNLISIKAGTTKGWIYPKFPIKVDSKLGSIVGHILGDGSIDKKFNQPFYTNKNKELLKEFEVNMYEIFGVKPRVWTQMPNGFNGKKSKWIKRVNSIDDIPNDMQGGLFYPKMSGLFLHAIFGRFAYGKHKKKITTQIWNTNNEFKKSLIRAFFDDEGSVGSDNIRVFQDNKKLLEDLNKMLIGFNIIPNKVLWYVKQNKRRYHFSINGHYNFIKFSELIDFMSLTKHKKLIDNINSIKIKRTFKLRKNETRNLIFSILKQKDKLTTNEIKFLLKSNFTDFLWDRSTILRHLHNLENLGLVSYKKVRFDFIWSINNV